MSHRVTPFPRTASRKPDPRPPVLDLSNLSAADRAQILGGKPKRAKAPADPERPKQAKRPPPPKERETEVRPHRKPEPGPWTLVLEWDLARTNPNKRPGKWGKIKANTAARRAGRYAWYDAGRPESDAPVIVDVVVQRARKLDQANIWAALKGPMDGMFVDGLTPDDNEQWLTLGTITQEPDPKWKDHERVLFHVRRATPLDGAPA